MLTLREERVGRYQPALLIQAGTEERSDAQPERDQGH
jgi:hypothetical protein